MTWILCVLLPVLLMYTIILQLKVQAIAEDLEAFKQKQSERLSRCETRLQKQHELHDKLSLEIRGPSKKPGRPKVEKK